MPLNKPLDFPRGALAFSICVFCAMLPLSVAGINIAWGLVLISLLFYAKLGGAVPWRAALGPLAAPLWIYLGVSILTAALGIDPMHSARYLHQDAHKVWIYMLFSVALATAYTSKEFISEPCRVSSFEWGAGAWENSGLTCMAIGFAAAAVTGFGETLASAIGGGPLERAHAFVHPVTFGEQMSLAVIGSICFLISEPAHSPSPACGSGQAERAGGRRVAVWIMLSLTAAALLLSKTEGAVAGCIGGLIAIGLALPRWRRRTLIALPVILLFAAGSLFAIEKLRYGHSLLEEATQWRQTGTFSNQGPLMRVTLWKVAWRMGWDHPWSGVGLNNYRGAFRQYFSGTLEGGAQDWGTAHNLYLHHFAERGLVGLAALALLLGVFWGRALQRARRSPDAWNLWAYGTATAFLIMNLTEVALQTEMIWMLAFFIWIWAEVRHASAPR